MPIAYMPTLLETTALKTTPKNPILKCMPNMNHNSSLRYLRK